MEGLYLTALLIVSFITLIPIILCIVLFFKVWRMTNDVANIKKILEEYIRQKTE